jgi:hypothetical protein
MPRSTIIAIGAGLVSSLLSLAAVGSGLGLLLAYFALLPILLIGLSQDRRAAIFAILFGVLGIVLLSDIYQGMVYSISIAFPAWLIISTSFTPKIKDKTSLVEIPIGEILSRLAFLGGIVLIISALIFSDKPNNLSQSIEVLLYKLIQNNHPDLNMTANHRLLVTGMVPLFPTIVFSSWLLMTIVSTMVAQSILIKAKANLRPAFQYSEITAPEWIYWAFATSGIFTLIGPDNFEYVSRNLTAIFLIPFLFIGLGVIHTVARTFRSPTIVLIPLYFFIVISSWSTIITVLIGFFETWANIRKKFKSNAPGDDTTTE